MKGDNIVTCCIVYSSPDGSIATRDIADQPKDATVANCDDIDIDACHRIRTYLVQSFRGQPQIHPATFIIIFYWLLLYRYILPISNYVS